MTYLARGKGWVREKATIAYDKIVYLCDHHTYVAPITMGVLFVGAVLYLFFATASALNEMQTTIRSIPTVVQVEMQKTRAVFESEAEKNREIIVDEHIATREELEKTKTQLEIQLKRSEYQRMVNQQLLKEIEKRLNDAQKRSKVLGIF